MLNELLYFKRTLYLLGELGLNYFDIDTAHSIMLKEEPNIKKSALYSSLENARWNGLIKGDQANRLKLKTIRGSNKNKNIYFFTKESVEKILRNIEDINKINSPTMAKILLQDFKEINNTILMKGKIMGKRKN